MSSNLTPDPNASPTLVPGGAATFAPPPINLPSPVSSLQLPPSITSAIASQGGDTAISYTPTKGPSRSTLFKENCLDSYINVLSNISLSMVSQDAIMNKLSSNDTQPRNLTAGTDYITFASTAEATTETTSSEYYNITEFTFTNFLGHTPQNPMTAIIYDAKMSMVEPYGFSIREDLQQLSLQMGYADTEPCNFTYRLEMWFSGYDPITGEWTAHIPIKIHDSLTLSSIIYYVHITTVTAVVTTQGTVYDLSIVQYSHQATRAETISLNFGSPGSTLAVKLSTGQNNFGNWLSNLAVAMNTVVDIETSGHFRPIYEFIAPTWLKNLSFSSDFKGLDYTTMPSYDPSSGLYTMSGSNSEIYTLIKKALDALPQYRELHLNKNDTSFIQPTTVFNLRTYMKYTGKFIPEINGYDSYTFVYIIEPVSSYRSKLTPLVENRNDRVQQSAQVARAQQLKNYCLIREYDFIFTNDNTEIIDFQYLFKNFYQEAYPHAGGFLPEYSQKEKDLTNKPNNQNYPSGGVSSVAVPNFSSQATTDDQNASGTISPGYQHGGLNRGPALADPSPETTDLLVYLKSLDQYYQYDMITGNITIRGDPIWLINSYMAKDTASDDLFGIAEVVDGYTIYSVVDRTIFIHAYKPIQSNFMNPNANYGSGSRALTLDGWYQVIEVANVFSGGTFVQRLNAFKYAHMNGAGFTNLGQANANNGALTDDPNTLVVLGG